MYIGFFMSATYVVNDRHMFINRTLSVLDSDYNEWAKNPDFHNDFFKELMEMLKSECINKHPGQDITLFQVKSFSRF